MSASASLDGFLNAAPDLHQRDYHPRQTGADRNFAHAGAGSCAIAIISVEARSRDRRIAEATGIFPRPAAGARRRRDVAVAILRQVDRRPAGALRVLAAEHRVDQCVVGTRRVEVHLLTPRFPVLTHLVGEQFPTLRSDFGGKLRRSRADQQHVGQAIFHRVGDAHRMPKSDQPADRAASARATIHHARIDFDDAERIRIAAIAHRRILDVVLDRPNRRFQRFQRALAFLHQAPRNRRAAVLHIARN